MTYTVLQQICCFADRKAQTVNGSHLSLHFPEEGILLLNGKSRYSTCDKSISIPISALREGENTLVFHANGITFRTEGIFRRKKTFLPCGIDEQELLFALTKEFRTIRAQLSHLEKEIAEYAQKALFS